MGSEIQRRPATALAPSNLDAIQVAEHFARTGWFSDVNDMSKAVVKILAGQEMGLGPMAAMQGIKIIQGKPTLSANLLATMVKRHPAYDFIPRPVTAEGAEIEFFQNGEPIGKSAFTIADAQRAGLMTGANWKKYPQAMCFARALSQGVRWYCPDVTAGAPAYVPEEMGAQVDAEGEVVAPVEQKGNGITEIPADMAEEIKAESAPEPILDSERAEQIVAGIKALGLTYKQINVMLGAAGVNAVRAFSAKALRERIDGLSDEEADAVERELAVEAERNV